MKTTVKKTLTAWQNEVAPNILVAEDNLINQKIIGHILENLGCKFDIVSNGIEACKLATNLRYDLIFMDCQMPEMDGIEATKSLKSMKDFSVPIIALTANAMKDFNQQCKEVGMDDYLEKPINIHAVEEKIRTWYQNNCKVSPSIDGCCAQSPSTQNIDFEVLEKIKNLTRVGEANFLDELVNLFMATTPQLIDNLFVAVKIQNFKTVHYISHRLKGTAMTVGIVSLAKKCSQLLNFT